MSAREWCASSAGPGGPAVFHLHPRVGQGESRLTPTRVAPLSPRPAVLADFSPRISMISGRGGDGPVFPAEACRNIDEFKVIHRKSPRYFNGLSPRNLGRSAFFCWQDRRSVTVSRYRNGAQANRAGRSGPRGLERKRSGTCVRVEFGKGNRGLIGKRQVFGVVGGRSAYQRGGAGPEGSQDHDGSRQSETAVALDRTPFGGDGFRKASGVSARMHAKTAS